MAEITDRAIDDLLAVSRLVHHRLMAPVLNVSEPGITRAHFGVLKHLEKAESFSIGSLCRELFLTKPRMSVILKEMKNIGLITSTVYPADRRVTLVSISPLGMQVLGSVSVMVRDSGRKWLARLLPGQIQSLSGALAIVKSYGDILEKE